jgi:hypothetical protein
VALQRVPLTLAELFAQAAEKVGHSDNCTSIHFRTRACDPQDCVREARLLALCARMAEAAVLAAYVEGDCRYPIGEHGPQSRIAAAAARVLEEYDG